MNSAEFYDNFIESQIKTGINDRIHGLYRRMCKIGLHTNSTVLEIGCGIGTLTYLLTRKIKKGRIEATDISPKSIEFIKKNLSAPNLFTYAGNILNLKPQFKAFDYILLFDVIEHIPIEDHAALFAKVSQWMYDDSYLLINIPNPAYILFDQKNNPSVLQETDQPVFINQLAAVLEKVNLDLVELETYSVWVKNDYQFIIVKKRKDFEEQLLSDNRNIFQKAAIFLRRKGRRIKYSYPPKS